jgi:hypothetical protein
MLSVSGGGLPDCAVIVDPFIVCVSWFYCLSVGHDVYGASLLVYSLRRAGVHGIKW